MAQQRKRRAGGQATVVVDGLTTIRAAQRAVEKMDPARKPGSPVPHSPPPPPPKPPPSPPKEGPAHGRHTVQPSRHDIVCYECGYSFLITGSIQKVYCAKCRTILDTGEHVIDAEWQGSIRTVGTVQVGAAGVVKGGKIIAGVLVVQGRIEGGMAQVNQVDLCRGSACDLSFVKMRDIVIRKDAEIELPGKTTIRNMEVAGSLSASVMSTGTVVVKESGRFRGEIVGEHLVVEDGATLDASLSVTASS